MLRIESWIDGVEISARGAEFCLHTIVEDGASRWCEKTGFLARSTGYIRTLHGTDRQIIGDNISGLFNGHAIAMPPRISAVAMLAPRVTTIRSICIG